MVDVDAFTTRAPKRVIQGGEGGEYDVKHDIPHGPTKYIFY
jgi:hypothetical protein